jgi:nicotinamide-nucleotide amidase
MEIVCVGNELLIGKVLNTNAHWLSKRATTMGIDVKRITVVRDVVTEISDVICEVLRRKPQFLITTGGLGPTFDDMTLKGVAEALHRKLAINEEALQMVKGKYAEYAKTRNVGGDAMTEPRVKMATLPEGTVPIKNPTGTAPGVRADVGGTVLIVLPGVPAEMEIIFESYVVPLLRQASGDRGFYEKSIFADRIMESVLAPLIDMVMHDNPCVYIKSHPKREEGKPHIELHFSTSGTPSDKAEEKLEKAAAQLSGLIVKAGGDVFAEDGNVN